MLPSFREGLSIKCQKTKQPYTMAMKDGSVPPRCAAVWRTTHCADVTSKSGSFAMLTAMRRASLLVSRLLTSRRCGSSSK
jgi:hypothetical protein